MKKIILFIVITLVISGGIIGVAIGGDTAPAKSAEMDECIEMVRRLQNADDKTRREITEQLKRDDKWTLLDEIGNPEVDEQEQYMTLGLNAMAYEAAMSKMDDYGNPQGVFVDGRDPDYSICFIEKSLSAGSEVIYTMKERAGSEEVAVVQMADGDLDVWMNGNKIEAKESVFRSQLREGEIKLRLRNRRGYAVNFVVINKH